MTKESRFPVDALRRHFPALQQDDGFVFFDNAAGAQIPQRVLDAVVDHLVRRNVQRGGPYPRSQEVDATIARARERVGMLVNASGSDEVAFGLNATSFIRTISLAVGQALGRRPKIVVSELDHEANIAAWLALEPMGARIAWWRVNARGDLSLADLEGLLDEQTRLVACTMASNALGTLIDIAEVSRLAHRAGAEVFVDAVHFAPHGVIDVRALDCDYLVCSGYKVFAPHMGFAWCRRASAEALPTYREHFVPDRMPEKLEAGTFVYENVAGMTEAVGYLEDLGRKLDPTVPASAHREAVVAGLEAIADYERGLSRALLDAIGTVPGIEIDGLTGAAHLDARLATVAFSAPDLPAADVASGLAARGVGVRDGHMYSPRLMTRLGRMPDGVVRVSLVHYNTADEIERFRHALTDVVGTLRRDRGR